MDSRVYDLLYSKAPLCEGNAKNERWVGGCCWVGVGGGLNLAIIGWLSDIMGLIMELIFFFFRVFQVDTDT